MVTGHPVTAAAVRFVERTLPDVPGDDAWLSERERDVLAGLRFEARRRDWRLGRWTAKLAVAGGMAPAGLAASDPRDIEILAAADGAPEAFVRGEPAPCSLSLSHRAGRALAVVAAPGVPVGGDLEVVEPRAPVFVADYFTGRERALVADVPPGRVDLMVTLIWSAKEAALKALRSGLRADTRWVEVELPGPGGAALDWEPLTVRSLADRRVFPGWWRLEDALVRTVVTGQSSSVPVVLSAG